MGLVPACGSDSPDRAADDGGGSGSDGGPLLPALTSDIGKACSSDDDCGGAPLFCLTREGDGFDDGGPPNGMCVADCTSDSEARQTICNGIDSFTLCLQGKGLETAREVTDDVFYCIPACLYGDDSDRGGKCQGRSDVACTLLGQTSSGVLVGSCEPVCVSDEDCGGRVCDVGSGLCVDAENRSGAPIGARCERDADCEGLCVSPTLNPDYKVCSGLCTIGVKGCGETLSSDEAPDAHCLLADSYATIGDQGGCLELCDCNDDCEHPDSVCVDFGYEGDTGRLGVCYDSWLGPDAGREGIPCKSSTPDAGAGGSGGSGGSGGGPDASSGGTASGGTGGTAGTGGTGGQSSGGTGGTSGSGGTPSTGGADAGADADAG
jgi:hypothetical protein